MSEQPAREYRYWAFISYSHKDEKQAKWLHRVIEKYGIPIKQLERGHLTPAGESVPKRFFPVFRDRAELPASSDLSETIRDALVASRYLIVICSPNAARSQWVNREVETFTELGRSDRIFAYIVDGDTDLRRFVRRFVHLLTHIFAHTTSVEVDSGDEQVNFPDALEEQEPLAADARRQGDGRNDAKLKLLAGMLGVGFDALKQRDKQQQAKRFRLIAAVALVLVMVFSLLALYAEYQRRESEVQAMGRMAIGFADQAKKDVAAYPQRSLLTAIEAVSYYSQRAGETGSSPAMSSLRYVLNRTGGLSLPGHQDAVGVTAISPDSRWLLTGDAGGLAFIWDLKADDLRATRMQLADHHGQITAAMFTPDGKLLVTTSADRLYGSGHVRIWVIGDGGVSPSPTFVSARGAGSLAAAVSPDSKWLVTSDGDYLVKLWDLRNFSSPPVTLLARSNVVKSIAFSRDGHWLAAASRNGKAYLWRVGTLGPSETPLVLRGHEDWVNAVAFSANSEWLFTGSGQWQVWPNTVTGAAAKDNSLVAWNLTADNPAGAGTLMGKLDSPVIQLVVSDSGMGLISVGLGAVRVWQQSELNHAVVQQQGEVLKESAGVAAFSLHSDWLVVGDSLWEPRSGSYGYGRYLKLDGHEGAILNVAFSPDGRWLVTAGADGLPRLWNLHRIGLENKAQATPLSFQSPLGWYHQAAFSPDGRWLALNFATDGTREWGKIKYGPKSAFAVYLWGVNDLVNGYSPNYLIGHNAAVEYLAFSGNGRWLTTLDRNREILLWDMLQVQSGPFKVPGMDPIVSLALSSDGRWLAALGDRTKTVSLWNLDRAPEAIPSPVVLRGHTENVNSIAFSPDSRWLLTGSDDNTARLWDLASATTVGNPIVLAGHNGDVRQVLVTPDGKWAVTSSYDHTVRRWDLQSINPGSESHPYSGYQQWDVLLGASSDGHWLVTVDGSNPVLWNLWRKQADAIVLTGHTAAVNAIDISPDSRWLISGDQVGEAFIWDLHSPQSSPAFFSNSGHAIEVVRVSGDGRYVLVVDTSGLASLILLRTDDLVTLACQVVGRNFTASEWNDFFPLRAYRPTCPDLPLPLGLVEPILDEAKQLAEAGDVAKATAKFQAAKTKIPTLNLDPSAEAERLAIGAKIEGLVKQDQTQEALDLFLAERAREGAPVLSMDAMASLCVFGSYASPVETKEICSEVIRRDDVPTHGVRPMGFALFGRGITRIAAHDYSGAVEDFTSITKGLNGLEGYDEFRSELGVDLDAWIADLNAGRIPPDAPSRRSYSRR